jgi:hypothetical protein
LENPTDEEEEEARERLAKILGAVRRLATGLPLILGSLSRPYSIQKKKMKESFK